MEREKRKKEEEERKIKEEEENRRKRAEIETKRKLEEEARLKQVSFSYFLVFLFNYWWCFDGICGDLGTRSLLLRWQSVSSKICMSVLVALDTILNH